MVNPTHKKHIVGAHYGLADWLAQRFTAAVMIVYTLFAFGILLWHGGLDHAACENCERAIHGARRGGPAHIGIRTQETDPDEFRHLDHAHPTAA